MNNSNFHQKALQPLVILFSDPNILAYEILSNLLASNCLVNIVTKDKRNWRTYLKNINSNKYFISDTEKYKSVNGFSYAIFSSGFNKKENTLKNFKTFLSNKNFGKAKTLAIFPVDSYPLRTNNKIKVSNNSGIIYVGDLLGKGINLKSKLLMSSHLNEIINKKTLTLGIGEIYFPLSAKTAANKIISWLLSNGPFGKETVLLGKLVTSSAFWKANTKYIPGLKIIYNTDIMVRNIPKNLGAVSVNTDINSLLKETYSDLLINKPVFASTQPSLNRATGVKNSLNKKIGKYKTPLWVKIIIPILLLILTAPFLSIVLTYGLLLSTYNLYLAEKDNTAVTLAHFSKYTNTPGLKESALLKKFPYIGKIYAETEYLSFLADNISDLAISDIPVSRAGKSLLDGVLGNSVYNIDNPVGLIKTGLDYTYQQLSLFKIKTQEASSQNVYTAKRLLKTIDLEECTKDTQLASNLIGEIPAVLGVKQNKTYLLLFQNNMELRPTGGFIGSYGIATFGSGRMTGLTVNDIYSADGQLRGHIEPPAPIKNYLNEANWWFRDSNWDPDFPTSAMRAEWFLNKEMGQQVDGVIAVDLEPIKDILIYTGPIFLPDYNLTISSENLYEKTQEETQANFFPGSRKKASFLTALSRVLLSEINKADSKQKLNIIAAIYKNLEGRHIQVYLHNPNMQDIINKLGWGGEVPSYSCGDNCYSDFFAGVEANVGVDKANYFIKRKTDLSINLSTKKVTRTVKINLQNNANPSLGAAGKYKNYLRILIPIDAKLTESKTVSGRSQNELTPEIENLENRKEVGVLVEITPGETKDVVFSWETEISAKSISSYGFTIRKQAGVDNDPLVVNLKSEIPGIIGSPEFTLTKDSHYTYNTSLSKDFFARFNWK